MNIHTRIKQRRQDLGYASHQAFAQEVGVSWQTVQQWEKEGGTAPNRSRIGRVAKALKTTPEWLLYGGNSSERVESQTAERQQLPPAPPWMAPEAYKLLTLYYSASDDQARAQIMRYAEFLVRGESVEAAIDSG